MGPAPSLSPYGFGAPFPPPAFLWVPSPGYGYANGDMYGAPPPPPLYRPPPPEEHRALPAEKPRKTAKADPYKSPDVKRLIVHVITVPAGAWYWQLFRGSVGPDYKGYKIPFSSTISDFSKQIGAFEDKLVIEEAVEDGDGHWTRGTKLLWGCQKPTSVDAVKWKRGNGLKTAADEPVWVVLRKKEEGEVAD